MAPKKRKEEWITEVKPDDVLFGRGSGPNDHEGNVRFRELISSRKPEYLATTHRQTKAQIAREVVDSVWRRGGRFLKRVDGGVDAWCEVDEDTTLEKAKQALRQNRQKDGSSPAQKRTSKKSEPPVISTDFPSDELTTNQASAPSTTVPSSHRVHVLPGSEAGAPVSTHVEYTQHRHPRQVYAMHPPQTTTTTMTMQHHNTLSPQSLSSDPFEPLPVEQVSNRMSSGLEVWADNFQIQSPSSSTELPDRAPSLPTSAGSGEYISEPPSASKLTDRTASEERRESLQISDLMRTDPLQQAGALFDDSNRTAEMDDLVDGVLRLSTHELEDSSTTMGTVEQRGLSHSTKGSGSGSGNMSGMSIEGESDSSLAEMKAGGVTSPSGSAADSSGQQQQQQESSRRGSDMSLQMSEIWKTGGGMSVLPESIIQEVEREDDEDVQPRRLSQLRNDPDYLTSLGNSSMSVLQTAIGDASTMSISKAHLTEFLDEDVKHQWNK